MRWKRLLGILAGALVGVYVLYVAAAAAFLSFGGLAWLTKNERDARVEIASGYSFWPGLAHFKGMKMRFQDYNIAMEVRLKEGTAQIVLWELVSKRVHFSHAVARGGEYRMIHRVHDAQKNAARLAAFPHIEGFNRPNFYDGPKPARSTKKQWSVKFDAIDAEVGLAWFLEYQLRGPMKARGSFLVDPNREAWVGPCEVDLNGVDVFIAAERIAAGVHGLVGASVDRFDPRDSPFDVVLPKLSARAEVEATITTLAPLDLYYRSDRFSASGNGTLHTDIELKRGQLAPGSASLELDPLTFRAEKVEVSGRGQLGLAAHAQGQFGVHGSFTAPDAKKAVSVGLLEAAAQLEHETLLSVEPKKLELVVQGLRTQGSELFEAVLPPGSVVPVSANLDAEASLDLSNRDAVEFDARIASTKTNFYLSGLRFGVTGTSQVSCAGTRDLAECALEVKGTQLVFNKPPTTDEATLWFDLSSKRDFRVSVRDGSLSGSFHLQGADPKPVLFELVGSEQPARLGVSLVATGLVAGGFRVTRRGDEVFVSELEIDSGPSRIRGSAKLGKEKSGAMTVATPAARIGIRLTDQGTSVHPFVSADWLSHN